MPTEYLSFPFPLKLERGKEKGQKEKQEEKENIQNKEEKRNIKNKEEKQRGRDPKTKNKDFISFSSCSPFGQKTKKTQGQETQRKKKKIGGANHRTFSAERRRISLKTSKNFFKTNT